MWTARNAMAWSSGCARSDATTTCGCTPRSGPSVERMLLDANIRNFTIFLHGDLLFGYYEYIGDDHDADQARIAADPEIAALVGLDRPVPGVPTEPGSASAGRRCRRSGT